MIRRNITGFTCRLLLGVLLGCISSYAEVITLKSGATITGNLIALQGGVFQIKTAGGEMQVPQSEVASITFENESSKNISVKKPALLDVNTGVIWPPADVDKSKPLVSDALCSLPDVLSKTGKRIQELTANVDKFTATEVVYHHGVDTEGHFRPTEVRKFDYLVSMAVSLSGYINVSEYRKDAGLDQFPDHIATLGTPALVLIFHPYYVKGFQMTCEGLGEWQGHPAWQVRFEELRKNQFSISAMEIRQRRYDLRLRGRAWILADSYQVAHLETDLAEEIPQIRLRLQHQEVEYVRVPLPENKGDIWLPSGTELYMDFAGHRFYRKHTFTDIELFSVKMQQTIGKPKALQE